MSCQVLRLRRQPLWEMPARSPERFGWPGLFKLRRLDMLTGVRALGLDVGMKTIGVAISDELGLAAHALTTVIRRGTAADVQAVAALAQSREAGAIVVGLPLELSGLEGKRVKRVRVFIDALKEHLGDAVAIHEWDERFSTAAVERMLIEADVSRKRRKEVIDKQAAAFILQGWLDAQRRALGPAG